MEHQISFKLKLESICVLANLWCSNQQCHSYNHSKKKTDLYIIIFFLETIRKLLQGNQTLFKEKKKSSLRKDRTHELPPQWENV